MPEFIVLAIPPLELALDCTPAVQTEHCATDHKGSSIITKEKKNLLMFFILRIYEKNLEWVIWRYHKVHHYTCCCNIQPYWHGPSGNFTVLYYVVTEATVKSK